MILSRPSAKTAILLPAIVVFAMACQGTDPAPSSENEPFEKILSRLKAYERTNQDSALWYEQRLSSMLPDLGPEEQLDAYTAMGLASYSAARYDSALRFFEQAAGIAETLGKTSQQAKLISRQGNTMTMQGKLEAALQLQEKALQLSQTLNEPGSERAYILQGLAYAYQKGQEPGRGIPYLEEALAYYESIESWRGMAYTTNLLQTAWSGIDSLDKAQQLLEAVLRPPIAPHLSAVDSGVMLNNLGRIYNMKGAYQKATEVLDQAIRVKSQLNNPDSYAKSIVEQMTSLKQAGLWSDCISLSEKISAKDFDRLSLYTRRDWYKQLSNCFAGDGQMKKAYETRLKYETLKDSVDNTQNREHIREVELRLIKEEQARLEQAEKIARQQRNLVFATSVIIGLTGLFLFLLWRARQRREAAILAVKAEELKKTDALRRQLFTNISHELRTPLTFVTAALQQILRTPLQEHRVWLNSLQNGVAQLQRLVNQVLDLSRLDAGKLKAAYTSVDGWLFFNRVASNWRPAAEIKGIQYKVHIDLPEKSRLRLDDLKTEQILNNLLSNALKFTPVGGTIRFEARLLNGHLNLTVADTGPGIPDDQVPYIFDRFFSAGQANVDNIGGAGIGLFFSQELARLMKGSLRVESHLGHGSTFYCQLPVEGTSTSAVPVQKSTEAMVPPPPLPDAPATPEATLLLVEDNPDMQRFLQQILSPHYRILSAFNGEEALEALQASNHIDLIVSDMMMPVMDGQQLLKKLKSEEKWMGLPVIMLTARAGEQERLRALAVGVDDYLTKPFSTPELLARITNLLKFRNLRHNRQPKPGAVAAPGISAADLNWLKSVEQRILSELQNAGLSVARLAQELHLSERQLHRRIKSVTGMTPNRYFWELRLHQAKQLLETGSLSTVAEVSYAVGIETPEYFSKKYKERFGKKPVAYFEK